MTENDSDEFNLRDIAWLFAIMNGFFIGSFLTLVFLMKFKFSKMDLSFDRFQIFTIVIFVTVFFCKQNNILIIIVQMLQRIAVHVLIEYKVERRNYSFLFEQIANSLNFIVVFIFTFRL